MKWNGLQLEGEIARSIELLSEKNRHGRAGCWGLRKVGLQRNQKKGSNLLSRLVGRGYGYKGQEIVEYLRRDPAVITRYLKEGKRLESEIGKVHEALRKTKKVNKEV